MITYTKNISISGRPRYTNSDRKDGFGIKTPCYIRSVFALGSSHLLVVTWKQAAELDRSLACLALSALHSYYPGYILYDYYCCVIS